MQFPAIIFHDRLYVLSQVGQHGLDLIRVLCLEQGIETFDRAGHHSYTSSFALWRQTRRRIERYLGRRIVDEMVKIVQQGGCIRVSSPGILVHCMFNNRYDIERN